MSDQVRAADASLFQGVESGDVVACRRLLEAGADPNQTRGKLARTPLHIAAKGGREEIARLLLQHGADVDASHPFGASLASAAEAGHEGVVRLLLQHGATPVPDSTGRGALHWAAMRGHAGVIRVLLASGFGPDTPELGTRHTPLHKAAAFGELDAVNALIEGGADVNAVDLSPWTPFDWARNRGHREIAAVIRSAGGGSTPRSQRYGHEREEGL